MYIYVKLILIVFAPLLGGLLMIWFIRNYKRIKVSWNFNYLNEDSRNIDFANYPVDNSDYILLEATLLKHPYNAWIRREPCGIILNRIAPSIGNTNITSIQDNSKNAKWYCVFFCIGYKEFKEFVDRYKCKSIEDCARCLENYTNIFSTFAYSANNLPAPENKHQIKLFARIEGATYYYINFAQKMSPNIHNEKTIKDYLVIDDKMKDCLMKKINIFFKDKPIGVDVAAFILWMLQNKYFEPSIPIEPLCKTIEEEFQYSIGGFSNIGKYVRKSDNSHNIKQDKIDRLTLLLKID
jgi:hypothetical protein